MITIKDLRTQTLFDCFDDADLEELSTQMADVILNVGEYLFFEGDPAAFYVLLEGVVELSHTVIRKRHVGGGNSAGQAAVFFASYAAQVTLLVRSDSLEKSMSQYLIDQLRTKANIAVELETEVVDISGQVCLEAIVTHHRSTDMSVTRSAYALFVMIGATAHTNWLPSELARDKSGFLLTGRDLIREQDWRLEREPLGLETSLPKVSAAGDVRHGSVKRVASGVGEGSIAISLVHQVL
jgi:thioredoxin reductase (NADPH)